METQDSAPKVNDGIPVVGEIVRLKRDCLGNKAGMLGVAFNIYKDFDEPTKNAAQYIFANGNYDGFSVKERALTLEHVGYNQELASYQFRNVIVLTQAFQAGYFKKGFEQKTK